MMWYNLVWSNLSWVETTLLTQKSPRVQQHVASMIATIWFGVGTYPAISTVMPSLLGKFRSQVALSDRITGLNLLPPQSYYFILRKGRHQFLILWTWCWCLRQVFDQATRQLLELDPAERLNVGEPAPMGLLSHQWSILKETQITLLNVTKAKPVKWWWK